MSFKVDITVKSLSEASDGEFVVTERSVVLANMAWLHIFIERKALSYTAVFGDGVRNDPVYREEMSAALYLLWCYCSYHSIPFINFGVVSDKSGVPGPGVKRWYKKTFGAEDYYEEWCKRQLDELLWYIEKGLLNP